MPEGSEATPIERDPCIHHWICGASNNGIIHAVCKICHGERDLPAYEGIEVDTTIRYPEKTEDNMNPNMRKKAELDARRDEIIAAWEKNQRNIYKTAKELGISSSTLHGKLAQWELIPRSPSKQPKKTKPRVPKPQKSKLAHQSQDDYAGMIKELEEICAEVEAELKEALERLPLLEDRVVGITATIQLLKERQAVRIEKPKQAALVQAGLKESPEKAG